MTDPTFPDDLRTMTIPVPLVAPFGIEMDQAGVQAVWDTFIKPGQEAGDCQSVEDRMLMAIIRAVHAGFTGVPE